MSVPCGVVCKMKSLHSHTVLSFVYGRWLENRLACLCSHSSMAYLTVAAMLGHLLYGYALLQAQAWRTHTWAA